MPKQATRSNHFAASIEEDGTFSTRSNSKAFLLTFRKFCELSSSFSKSNTANSTASAVKRKSDSSFVSSGRFNACLSKRFDASVLADSRSSLPIASNIQESCVILYLQWQSAAIRLLDEDNTKLLILLALVQLPCLLKPEHGF